MSKKKEYTVEEKLEILQVLNQKKGNYKQAANKLDMTSWAVEEIEVSSLKLHNYTPEGKGVGKLQKYLIARRHIHREPEWDNKSKVIKKARDDYDAGYVEVCQGRDGLYILLYCIPRKVKDVNRKIWFAKIEEEDNVVTLGA